MAILLYFYEDWKEIFSNSYFIKQVGKIFIDRKREFFDAKKMKGDLLVIIAIATIPGAIVGVLLEKYAENYFRSNMLLIGFTFLAGAMLLFFAEKIGKKNLEEKEITLKNAIYIGLFQMFAIIPGMSRSGTTISGGLIFGLSRINAARFSFLLATPIILGAVIKESPAFLHSGMSIDLMIGVLSAFISGYLAIKYMLQYLENKSYNIFVIYRLMMALAIFLMFAGK
jgi:undecaprenyl-diphosphatase